MKVQRPKANPPSFHLNLHSMNILANDGISLRKQALRDAGHTLYTASVKRIDSKHSSTIVPSTAWFGRPPGASADDACRS